MLKQKRQITKLFVIMVHLVMLSQSKNFIDGPMAVIRGEGGRREGKINFRTQNQKKSRKSVNEAKHDQEGDEDETEENTTTTRRNTVRLVSTYQRTTKWKQRYVTAI